MTSADDTNPNGRVHSDIDVASMAERAADKAHDAKQIAMHADDRSAEALHLSKNHAAIIETIPAMHVKLDLALRPVIVPVRVSNAAVFAAASLGVLATCAFLALAIFIVHAVPSAFASNQDSTHEQRPARQ